MQNRYTTRQIVIHWLTLVLVIAAFYLGHELDEMDRLSEGAEKMATYPIHFWLGNGVLFLTLARIFVLIKDGKPEPVAGGNPLLDKLATGIHHLLYVLLLAIPVSGIVLKTLSGLTEVVASGDVSQLPDLEDERFELPHEMHAFFVEALLALVALHAAAALFHQFVRKDGLMNRMSLRCRGEQCDKK